MRPLPTGETNPLQISLYNGSGYTVHEIVVEVTDRKRILGVDERGRSLDPRIQEILEGGKKYKVLEKREFRLVRSSLSAEASALQTSYWPLDLGYAFGHGRIIDLSIEVVSATGLLEAAK